MKLIASGVTKSAASTRSPSFSRSSSSTRITILPALISAIISVIGLTDISIQIRFKGWNADHCGTRQEGAQYNEQAYQPRDSPSSLQQARQDSSPAACGESHSRRL